MWIKAGLRRKFGSRLYPPKAAPPELKTWKARKRPVNGCSLDIGTSKIRTGPGALPDVEIEQNDKFEEMWETMGAENKLCLLAI